MTTENQPPSPEHGSDNTKTPTFLWGMTEIPMFYTPAHFFVTGGFRDGNSITLRLLMLSVMRHIGSGLGHRAIVFDSTGAIGSWLRGIDLRCPLHNLSALDGGGTAWDIAADVDSYSGVQQLATSLIPEEAMGGQSFFADAARQILESVCLGLIKLAPGKWTLRDVLLALQNRESLLSLLAKVPETRMAAQFTVDDRLSANVLSTIRAKLQPFETMVGSWQNASSKLSLKTWLHNESVVLVGKTSI